MFSANQKQNVGWFALTKIIIAKPEGLDLY